MTVQFFNINFCHKIKPSFYFFVFVYGREDAHKILLSDYYILNIVILCLILKSIVGHLFGKVDFARLGAAGTDISHRDLWSQPAERPFE